MKNRRLTNIFMSSMPAKAWEKMGKKYAISVLNSAVKNIPAYREFLKENNLDPDNETTFKPENFQRLPIMDKKNYILKYPLKDISFNFDNIYTVERSSGYSNVTTFWPRLPEEDALFPSYIEYAFVQFYGIDKKRTLAITTLALGTWVSGEKMAQALRMTALKDKYKLTAVSPGANLEDTLEIVKNISPNFEQTIIVGYPPFIKSVIEEGIKQGIDWKKMNTRIGLGGEGYSERYRESIAEIIGLDKNDLLGVSGGYGAADLGMTIGREYALTVLIRKLATKDKELSKALFDSQVVPALLQYSPSSCYIESFKDELLFTIKAGIPVIRYNIHDRGGVIKFDDMIDTLKKFNYDIITLLGEYGYASKDIWKLPFFYVFGRSDGTVCVSGMNVYLENIEAALHTSATEAINSFKLSKEIDKDNNEKLSIILELKKDTKQFSDEEMENLKKIYQSLFLETILENNKDFEYVYKARPDKMKPIIKIFYFEQGPFKIDINKIKKSYISK